MRTVTIRKDLPEICRLRKIHRGLPTVNGLRTNLLTERQYSNLCRENRWQRSSENANTHRPNKRSPAWSPDGDTIAYTSWDALFDRTTIHLMTAEGEHLKQLSEEHDGSDTDPDWFAPVGWSVSPAANFVTIWGKIKKPTSALRCCARRA